MANLNLPESIADGQLGWLGDLEALYAWANLTSRDTGWRDLSGLLINGWTATSALVRRTNNLVEFRFRGLTGGTEAAILDIGGGAGQLSDRFFAGVPSARSPHFVGTGVDCFFTNTANKMFCILENGTTDTGSMSLSWVFTSQEAWPSSLPPAV